MANTVAVLNILVNANTGAAVGQLTALDGKLKQTSVSANKTSTAIGTKLASAAKLGGAALAAGLVVGLVKSAKAASAFETSFAEVRKTVDATEAGFGRLEKGLRSLSKQIPVNVNELNELAGQAGALGVASKDIVQFTKTAVELGIATDMSAESASNALARLTNIMGTSSKDFRRLGSAFVALGNDGASTESEIANMALRLAATGKQVGLSESQVLSFSSALASVGIEAEAGGSAFSRAFSKMSEAVATGSGDLDGFAEVAAMSSERFAKLFERNAARAMIAFVEGLGRIRDEGGNALVTLKDLEINEVRLRNALLSAAGAGQLFDDQLRIGAKAWRENNALTQEAQQRYQTNAAKIEVLENRVNNLAITIGQALDPAVKELLGGLDALTSGRVGKWLDDLERKSQTAADAVDVLRASWKVLGPVFATVGQLIGGTIKAIVGAFQGMLRMIRAIVRTVASIFQGDWAKAWENAKDIAGGYVDAIGSVLGRFRDGVRAVFDGIRDVMQNIFGDAWSGVEGIFIGGANAVIGVVNKVIDVINMIPGVPDIGNVDKIGGSRSAPRKLYDELPRKQRGGSILGGKPSGDSIPAMLERGEYVLNRKAVQAIGARQLDAINFGSAPRFQVGGFLGKVAGVARDVAGRGAGWFLNRLPKPNLPEPFTGLGPYVIDNVTKWIRGKAKSDTGAIDLGSAPPQIRKAMELAQAMGLSITSGFPLGTPGAHAKDSWHYQSGRAFDTGGSPADMMAFALAAVKRWGATAKEIFYSPLGFSIKNGMRTGLIAEDSHYNHVHVAMQNGGLVKGRVSYFNDGTTASGISAATKAGLALNLNPGTDSGWNNDTTQGWMTAARNGKPVYARVNIAGKSAVLPIIDLGPAGWTGRAIDVTQKGIEKMGFTTANFPTDAQGTVKILGAGASAAKNDPPASARQRATAGRLAEAAAKIRKGSAALRGQYKRLGGTAWGQKALDRGHDLLGRVSQTGRLDTRANAKKAISRRRSMVKDAKELMDRAQEGANAPGLTNPSKILNVALKATEFLDPDLRKRIRKMLRAPEITWEEQEDILAIVLGYAEQTEGIEDDRAVHQWSRRLAQLQIKEKREQLRRVKAVLRTPQPPAKQERLKRRRANLIKSIGVLTGTRRAAREAIRDLAPEPPSSMDFARRDLALARLTEGAGDDLAALKHMENLAAQELEAAKLTADPTDDIDAAQELLGIRDELKALTESINDREREIAEAQKALAEEMKRENDLHEHVMKVTSREALRLVTDQLSGQVAGRTRQAAPSGINNQTVRL